MSRVDTLTFRFAVFELIWFSRLTTTVALVVFAPTVVVASVTNTVTCPVWMAANTAAHRRFRCVGGRVWIQTFAVFAMLELVLISGVTTAITFIPSTTAVVVVIVTYTIFSPSWRPTLAGTEFLQRVQALARFAVFIVVFLSTAVATIPAACAVVVSVVTVLVPLPIRRTALSGSFRALFDFRFTIFALAFRTIRLFVDFG